MLIGLEESGRERSDRKVIETTALGAQEFHGRITGIAESRAAGGCYLLAMHGSLFNLRELFSRRVAVESVPQMVLDLYLAEGIGFLAKLRGEFAIALWDDREQTLWLATDRFRIHPLFYYNHKDVLVFASRLHGVTACPLVASCTLDHESLVHVVAGSMIPTPATIFREIKKLPPGHLLSWRQGELRVDSYWDIKFSPSDMRESDLASQLRKDFADAIAVRLEQDGTSDHIGTFLSGGIDSSTVTGVMTQLTKGPVRSFSIGFGEERFNEIEYARIAARAFASQHTEYFVTPKDVLDVIPVLSRAFDEPYANASAVPTYYCARVAREQGVNILYAGDGGDELFAGNERYATRRVFDYYHIIPPWLRTALVEPLVSGLAETTGLRLFARARKYIDRANVPYPERLAAHGVFEIVLMQELLHESLLGSLQSGFDTMDPMYTHYRQAPAWTQLDRELYVDLKLTISDNDVLKVIRTSEATGVVVRFPFLDHRLAEFAAMVPARMKMKGMELRTFFKRAYSDLLPAATRAKHKHGFGLPIPIWLKTDRALNDLMQDLVLSPRAQHRDLYKRRTIEQIVQNHRTDSTSFYGTLLWNLMMIELWFRTWQDAQHSM
jgi:asparagine synthase (glutamine-hydrolysing)